MNVTGALNEMNMDIFDNPAAQHALWNVTCKVAGSVGYPE